MIPVSYATVWLHSTHFIAPDAKKGIDLVSFFCNSGLRDGDESVQIPPASSAGFIFGQGAFQLTGSINPLRRPRVAKRRGARIEYIELRHPELTDEAFNWPDTDYDLDLGELSYVRKGGSPWRVCGGLEDLEDAEREMVMRELHDLDREADDE